MRHHKYKLISIINHYGSFNGGHYTSCGRVKNNKWLSYNDSKINEINLDKIKNNFEVSSYLLLYEKIVNQQKK
jgi:ubiquitin C-terminal hydrolase